MAQAGRIGLLRFSTFILLLTGMGGGRSAAQEPAGTHAAGLEPVPYVISLTPHSGRVDREDRVRASQLAGFLRERLAPLLEGTPYSGVEVEVLPDWDQTALRIRQGGSQIIECDPVLYFVTMASRDSLRARYEVVLQFVADPMPRGQILAPADSGLAHPDDLQGRRIAFVHRFAGGAAQIQRALNERGLSANRDYSVWHAGYVENAFLNLSRGNVDAVAVSSWAIGESFGRSDPQNLVAVLETDEVLSSLFARRRSDADRFPGLAEAAVETLRSFFGPGRLVPAADDFYERTREEGLPWE
jgi:hypothetical protein